MKINRNTVGWLALFLIVTFGFSIQKEDKKEMILFPSGSYTIGSENLINLLEEPDHLVKLNA
jgi:hypothetical protein